MTGPVAAALVLAGALLVAPSSVRRRVGVPRRRWPAGWVVSCAAAAAVAVLPAAVLLAAALAGATATVRYRRRRRLQRNRDESSALASALEVLVGELGVGAQPVRAVAVAAAETETPEVGAALRGVAARARLGADVPAGLRDTAASSTLAAHWERLAMCWQLAEHHGLAMVTLLRTAQRDLTERQRFSTAVTASLAGARATAAILAALPVLGVLLGQLIGAAPLRFLLGGHTGGGLLVAGVTLTCAGLLWSDRITDRVTGARA
ncbi:type II secretion system F family protein [Mycobacterium sp. pUA109]|uniref:type II secretion system F family protein n=1 Tax=Mycobacterium sp. pUA109 TaxID=3238982 RepID=UPI00351BDB48